MIQYKSGEQIEVNSVEYAPGFGWSTGEGLVSRIYLLGSMVFICMLHEDGVATKKAIHASKFERINVA